MIAKIQKQLKCPLMHGRLKKMWHIHTMEYYAVLKKGSPVICNYMGEPEGHYAT